mgnify:CR=1 FL=1
MFLHGSLSFHTSPSAVLLAARLPQLHHTPHPSATCAPQLRPLAAMGGPQQRGSRFPSAAAACAALMLALVAAILLARRPSRPLGWGLESGFPSPLHEDGPLWEPELSEYFAPLNVLAREESQGLSTGPRARVDDIGLSTSGVVAVNPAEVVERHAARASGRWATIPRVRDVSQSRFAELAASGQPFVIADGGRDLPLLGSTCREYAETWPNASMRAEYFDEGLMEDHWHIFRDEEEGENKISLSHPLWWNTYRRAKYQQGIEHHMAAEEKVLSNMRSKASTSAEWRREQQSSFQRKAAPLSTNLGVANRQAPEAHRFGPAQADGTTSEQLRLAAPYIWHVKDQEPLATKRSVQARWRPPYFARFSFLNAWEASENFEFWFSLPGGGTMAHGDAYCELTISLQLRGKKRWRLMMMPAADNTSRSLDTTDGKLYTSEFDLGVRTMASFKLWSCAEK